MLLIITAIPPIFLLILLGYLLNQWRFPDVTFWPLAARITYFVLLPALLIKTLATADLADLPVLKIVAAFALAISTVSIVLLILRPRLPLSEPAFTSVFQGGIRQNSYIGLATAAGLLGESQLAFAAIALASQVPIVNLWSVAVLTQYGDKPKHNSISPSSDSPIQRTNIGGTVVAILRNPLILACAVGMAFNPLLPMLTGSTVSPVVVLMTETLLEVLSILGRAALPFGLLTVGAGLRLALDRSAISAISIASISKLLVYPLIAALCCWLLGITGPAYLTVIIFAALPTSTSAYILARELGGDHELMAAVLTVETLLATLSMPLILMILG